MALRLNFCWIRFLSLAGWLPRGKDWFTDLLSHNEAIQLVYVEPYTCIQSYLPNKPYRAVAITLRKRMTKHFHVAKKYCAQWQLKWSQCQTHDLCAIFIGFTQRDNCDIAIVNIIKGWVPSCSRFWVHCTTDHSFATQTRKITEITKNKQRDVQLIYGRDVTCNRSIVEADCWSHQIARNLWPLLAKPKGTNLAKKEAE